MSNRRVVLDTNVLVSAFLFDGKPRELFGKIISGSIRCFLSESILHEFNEVLQRPKFGVPHEVCQQIIQELYAICEVVAPSSRIDVVRSDPDDNRILECALEAKADFLVTGDRHLLEIGTFRGIEILDPASCLSRIA
jgi:putative PIN family toxin of toxin-antitoxin system